MTTVRRATELLSFRIRVHDTVQSAKGRYDFGRLVTRRTSRMAGSFGFVRSWKWGEYTAGELENCSSYGFGKWTCLPV